jgi:hypothetical protein
MRSLGSGFTARALPQGLPLLPSTPRCTHCDLPLQHVDLEEVPPCEALANRIHGDTETCANRQHWSDIHKELPPGPGERKKSGELRETPQPALQSHGILNIGELNRWVLLRGPNLEDSGEKLQHDILWHFSPHKICWNKSGTQGATPTSTPRSKNSTPSQTPKAGGGRPALSEAKSFGAALPTSTPRSKSSTPSQTPKAGGGRPALSGAKSFGAIPSMQGSGTANSDSGGVANVDITAARKRSMTSSFSPPPNGTIEPTLSTVPRKKLNYSNLKIAPVAILHQSQ